MILLIDNYDSFSYNLYQLVGELNPDIRVIRNNELTVPEIAALAPEKIILSPGPGRPEDAGVTMDVVKELGGEISILGVCLGHQAICAAFGVTVTYARQLMHGKQSTAVFNLDCPIFQGCPASAKVPGTTPWRLTRLPCRSAFWSPPGRRTGKSWPCSTGSGPFSGCSSTRSPS